jgi:sulfate adenylyltransferase
MLDCIVAKNLGCHRFVIAQNHTGLGLYYDHNKSVSIASTFEDIGIEVEMSSEFVYCNECKTLVSTKTCPHGKHHHITYRSESIAEMLKKGLLPPAVLVRKEISAILLSNLFPNRFKNLTELYDSILPNNGLVENHNEEDFYIALMQLYQTTSLT